METEKPCLQKAKEAVGNAEHQLVKHLAGIYCLGLCYSSDTEREVTANLCEAYLDEWHTYRQLRQVPTERKS